MFLNRLDHEMREADNEHGHSDQARELRLDKIAVAVVVSALTAFGGILWSLRSDVSQLELKNAELKGAQTTILSTLADIQSKGSATAQRTEILVMGLQDRFGKIEDFMSRGPRFTRDDGDRIEKRLEKIEQRIETLHPSAPQNRR
jgi:seryl-tRNA(Sec) selenium transferase